MLLLLIFLSCLLAVLQYDTDVTTWSPAGRLHQVEYAMEAVKHGSACAGLKGKNAGKIVSQLI